MLVSPVARRSLKVLGSDSRTVVVSIGQPKLGLDPEFPEVWGCAISIEGITGTGADRALGEDSLQALLLAVELVRKRLDESGLALAWLDDEPGHTCIPRTMAAYAFDAQLAREVEQHIDHRAETYHRFAPGSQT